MARLKVPATWSGSRILIILLRPCVEPRCLLTTIYLYGTSQQYACQDCWPRTQWSSKGGVIAEVPVFDAAVDEASQVLAPLRSSISEHGIVSTLTCER